MNTVMSQYLASLLKLDCGRYFRKSRFMGEGQGSEDMQMSRFGSVAMKQVAIGKRAYTDGVEAWTVSYTHLDVYKRQVFHSSSLIAWYDGKPKGGTFYTYRKATANGLKVINLYDSSIV